MKKIRKIRILDLCLPQSLLFKHVTQIQLSDAKILCIRVTVSHD